MLCLVCLFPRSLDLDEVEDTLYTEKKRAQQAHANSSFPCSSSSSVAGAGSRRLKKRPYRQSRQEARAHKYLLRRIREGSIQISTPSNFRHELHLDPQDAAIQIGLLHAREGVLGDRDHDAVDAPNQLPTINTMRIPAPALEYADSTPTCTDSHGVHSDTKDMTFDTVPTLSFHSEQDDSRSEESDENQTLNEHTPTPALTKVEIVAATHPPSPPPASPRRAMSIKRKPVPALDVDTTPEVALPTAVVSV